MTPRRTWAERASELKRDTYALYLAYRDPRVPWYAKALAAFVVAYALSPIDLIPDFIPILGYLDDLVLIPLGVALVLKWIPPAVMSEARERAGNDLASGSPASRLGAVIVILVWLLGAGMAILLAIRLWMG